MRLALQKRCLSAFLMCLGRDVRCLCPSGVGTWKLNMRVKWDHAPEACLTERWALNVPPFPCLLLHLAAPFDSGGSCYVSLNLLFAQGKPLVLLCSVAPHMTVHVPAPPPPQHLFIVLSLTISLFISIVAHGTEVNTPGEVTSTQGRGLLFSPNSISLPLWDQTHFLGSLYSAIDL